MTPQYIARWGLFLAILIQFPCFFVQTNVTERGLLVLSPLSATAAKSVELIPATRWIFEVLLAPGTWFRDSFVDLGHCMMKGKDGMPDIADCRFSNLWNVTYVLEKNNIQGHVDMLKEEQVQYLEWITAGCAILTIGGLASVVRPVRLTVVGGLILIPAVCFGNAYLLPPTLLVVACAALGTLMKEAPPPKTKEEKLEAREKAGKPAPKPDAPAKARLRKTSKHA